MKITGIICEYNPLHLGHQKQLSFVKTQGAAVCLMSGNFVQRGKPAIFDKTRRAEAAVRCGADLVLELPITAALSSAEGFASQGVRILGGFCDQLCFGAETPRPESLNAIAEALLSPAFSERLRGGLDRGLSFPAARQAALEDMGLSGELIKTPNNILAIEYCKAIISQNSQMTPLPIARQGSYHDTVPDPQNPSATAVRQRMESGAPWRPYVPRAAAYCFENAPIHTLKTGQTAILARLRTMTDGEFAALPYGSEGLWRKLMHAARREAGLEEILEAAKSKRYTRTRLDRMVMCAFLGLTERDLATPAPYVRVLAFNDTGRHILKKARLSGAFLNIGQWVEDPYQLLESRAGALYGLFTPVAQPPTAEADHRVFYLPDAR